MTKKQLQDDMAILEGKRKSVVEPSSSAPFIWSIVVMATIVISGVVFLQTSHPEIDNTATMVQIFGFAGAIATGLFAAMKSAETHRSVNSRLDEWMRNAEMAAEAKGISEGRDAANLRTDELAAAKKNKDQR